MTLLQLPNDVPKGVEHRPSTGGRGKGDVVEPMETKHTGNSITAMTVEKLEWILAILTIIKNGDQ